MDQRRLLVVVSLLLAALLLFILGTCLFRLMTQKEDEYGHKIETETQEETEIETESESEETESEMVYEPSAYDFRTEEVTVKVADLSREYTLAWVSDLHMITDKEAAEDILEEDLPRLKDRYSALYENIPEAIPTEPGGLHGEDLWMDVIDYLNYHHFDGIIFGGDIIDYCSKSNMNYLQTGLSKLNPDVPVLYLRADHDYGYGYGGDATTEELTHKMQAELDGDDLEQKYLDFDEFMVIGVNESTRNLPAEEMRIIREQMEEGKPLILATHVPFASQIEEEEQSLENLSMEVRGKIYYWGGEQYQPDEVTGELLERLYDKHTPVKAVLAGHMHAPWEGKLTDRVTEHIFSPGFSGVIGIVHVVPKD